MQSLITARPRRVRASKSRQASQSAMSNVAEDSAVGTPEPGAVEASRDVDLVELLAGSMRSVLVQSGTVIDCVRGTLWLTEDHSTRDVVLGHGDRYHVARPGRVIVVALTAGAYRIQRQPSAGATGKQPRAPGMSLRRFLRSSRLRSRLPAVL